MVDDDAVVRDGLLLLMESADLDARAFDSAEAFLEAFRSDRPCCLVLDMRMPGMDGLGLQAELARRGVSPPIIFLTAHGDIPTTVRALKAGAADFLTKPVSGAVLLECVQTALRDSVKAWAGEAPLRETRARLEALTAREREILELAVGGLPNKAIARRLGISFRTVEGYRSRILQKTGTESLIELAHRLGRTGPLGDDVEERDDDAERPS
ncbi:MAG: response regulator [Burkholderiales bacterium]